MLAVTTQTRPYNKLVLDDSGTGFANPRVRVDMREIGELAESIATEGLLYPLCVWETTVDGERVNVVVEGGRRWRAIGKLLKEKRWTLADEVPIRVIKAQTVQEARVVALVGNVHRVDLSSYEVARSMAELRSDGMKQKDIARTIKKSKSWVSRKMAAWDHASPTVTGAWKAGWLPDEDVEALSSIRLLDEKTGKLLKEPDHKEQDRRLEKLLAHRAVADDSGKVSRKAAGKARKIAKGGEPRGERPNGDKVRRYAETAADSKDAYVRGLHDMARYVLGEMPVGKFDKAWIKHAAARGFYKSDSPVKSKALAKRKAPTKKKTAAKRAK